VLPRTLLVALEPFGERLSAQRAGAALARGVQSADVGLEVDLCPLETRAALPERAAGDGRLRAARAVILGGARLDEATLLDTATFELATRARQAGVPAYAVTASNDLSLFDARILDLQIVLQARDVRGLRRAGERLAQLV
jgi:glycerate kinase